MTVNVDMSSSLALQLPDLNRLHTTNRPAILPHGDNIQGETMGTVYRTAQLEELGLGRRRRTTMVEEGRLHRVEHGVYTTAPPEGDLLLRALALTRPQLVYSGITAHQIYAGGSITAPAEGLVQRPASYRSTPLINVGQVRVLPFRTVNGHRVVPPAMVAADLALTDASQARALLEEHYAGRGGHDQLNADLAQQGRVPVELRKLIASSSIGADSNSERTLFRALKKKGVNLIQNYQLGHYHWDAAIPSARILIELDSFRYHAALADGENERTFIIDRWKANDGARRGWLVLHYTGECVYRHLGHVIDQIMDTIEWQKKRRRRDPLPELLSFELQPPWDWHYHLRAHPLGTEMEPPFWSAAELRAAGIEPGSPEDPNGPGAVVIR